MKPRIKQAEAKTADGGTLALYEQDGAFSINFNGQELMHSKATASEVLLGKLGAEALDKEASSRVLIGGLGLGFTLRSVLEVAGPKAVIEVVELVSEVIDWNRELLKDLNGELLEDPRVEVRHDDVAKLIRKADPNTYDSIILDVDNGPTAMVTGNNFNLYSKSGVRLIRSALKVGGRVVFWSAGPDQKFELRLKQAGFEVSSHPAKVHEGAKRAAYLLYVAQ